MTRSARGMVPAAGLLVVSQANPRYFAVASGEQAGKAIYLTGSHIWNNFHDGMGPGSACANTPERMDFDAYLDFLQARGHNFIRLWRWEQVVSQAAGGDFHLCMTPQPWARTGPGEAKDGEPRSISRGSIPSSSTGSVHASSPRVSEGSTLPSCSSTGGPST
jgi:hypothetical protein